MTLHGIVENIAYTFKEQYNSTLRASIEDSVIEYRALLIRRSLDAAESPQQFLNGFCVEMELVDNSECPEIKTGVQILRSKQVLPKTVRIKGNGKSPYNYVGSIDRRVPYFYSTTQGMDYMEFLAFSEKNVYYTLYNDRLFLLNRKKNCKVFVEGIIEDPRKIENCDTPDLFPDEIDFACPADMLVGIKNAIKKEYFSNLITDGNEVNIDKDGQS